MNVDSPDDQGFIMVTDLEFNGFDAGAGGNAQGAEMKACSCPGAAEIILNAPVAIPVSIQDSSSAKPATIQ